VLISVLAGTALVAITTGRLGWKNYWGGFVYAPFALVIALLVAMAAVKRYRSASPKQRGRR